MKKLLHLFASGSLLLLLRTGAAAADFVVTTTGDTIPASPGSLRAALESAAANGTTDTITFSAAAFTSGSHTITLAGELPVAETNGVMVDATAAPYGVTIDGAGARRLISVAAAGKLALNGLTLTGGNGTGAALSGNGGAIYNAGALTLERCTLSGNSAAVDGGAIFNVGTLGATQCTFSGNQAGGSGGAIADSGTAPLALTHCTIAANSAGASGGGLVISGAIGTLWNSIISGNTAPQGADLRAVGPAGGVTRVGANVIRSFSKTPDAPDSGTVAITADPLLGPLANNGGTTQTHALLAYSQAISGVPAGAEVADLNVDQRGFPRTLGSAPDLGAYESGDAEFGADGLTLFARVPANQIGTGVFFEISANADFSVPNPLVSTLSGAVGAPGAVDGSRLDARYYLPSGVAQDSAGNIFIADTVNNVIRMLGTDAVVTTIAGSGVYGLANGPGLTAAFAFPSAIAVGPDDNVYVTDTYNHRICKLTRPPVAGAEWTVTTLAGTGTAGFLNGSGSVARFNFPYGLDLDSLGNVYVADSSNHRIRKITPAGVTSTFAGTGIAGLSADAAPVANAQFNVPQGVAVVSKPGFQDIVCVADRANNCIRQITTTSDGSGLIATAVTTLAGSAASGFLDATGTAALFRNPSAVTSDSDRNIYVADEQNHAIRKVTLAGVVTTVAGTGAPGFLNGNSTSAQFNAPTGVLVARDGTLVVADSQNDDLRSIAVGPLRVPAIADPLNSDSVGQQLSAVLNLDLLQLSPGTQYYFRYRLPDDTTQPAGQSFTFLELPLVVTQAADRLTPATGRLNGIVDPNGLPTTVELEYSFNPDLSVPLAVSTLAGAGSAGYQDSGTASLVRFNNPRGLVVSGGDIYVADYQNHRIRRINSAGSTITFAGSTAGFVNGLGAAARFDRPAGIAAEPDIILEDCATVYGSTTVSCADTSRLAEGVSIRGTNVATGATVVSITDGTHFVISIAAVGTTFDHTLTAGGANFYVADAFNHCIRKITAKGQVTVLAGSSLAGFADGSAATARFLYPVAVAVDSATPPNVYVADSGNHRIRKVAPDGSVSTFAGVGSSGFANGAAETSQFASPSGVAVDADGDILVADTGNHLIRRISGGVVTSFAGSTRGFADGSATEAKFDGPSSIASAGDGSVFVADGANHRIRLIRAGEVSTYAGSGIAGAVNSPAFGLYPPRASQFDNPAGIAVGEGGELYVSQEGLVRKIADRALPSIVLPTAYTGTASIPVAGDVSGLLPGTTYYFRAKGTCLQAVVPGAILEFTTPAAALAVSAGASASDPNVVHGQATPIDFGTTLRGAPVSRQFTIFNPNGQAVTVTSISIPGGYELTAGSGINVIPAAATFTFEITLTATSGGRKSGTAVISSDAPGLTAFAFPIDGIVVDRPIVSTQAATQNLAGGAVLNGTVNPLGNATSVYFQWSLSGQYDGVLVSTLAGSAPGYAEGVGSSAKFNEPSSMAVDAGGNLYVADRNNHRIRRISPGGTVTTFAGTGVAGFADGAGASAQFNEPTGIAISSTGTLFVCDSLNHRIRAITPGGEVRTFSGSSLGEASFTDGVGTAARFSTPWAIAIDSNDILYVADRNNHRIRKVALDGSVSTLAGNGAPGFVNGSSGVAQFNQPIGIAVDAVGSVYVTEATSHALRKITVGGTTSTFAGSQSTAGFIDGSGTTARFSNPTGLGVDRLGAIYVADKGNQRIRKMTSGVDGTGTLISTVVTLAGTGLAGNVNGLKDVAQFNNPISVLAVGDGQVVVGELTAATIRTIDPTEPLLPVISGLTGTTSVPVALQVNGLTVGATYYYRLVATNIVGPSYGNSVGFLAGSPFELWQLAKFGADASPVIAGDGATPANDGVINRVKYALGLDPFVNASGNLPVLTLSNGTLSLTYARAVAATDVLCTAQWSSDLITWNTVGITEQVFPPDGPLQQITASIPIAPDRIKFLRLNVTFK